jgi:hypothetical protein
VVHHVRRAGIQDRERAIEAAAEVGREDLDARGGRQLPYRLDAVDEMPGAAVAQVVAVDARDHDVAESERRDRLAQVARLLGIERVGAAVGDVAEGTAPRAELAHDHEGRGAVAEALADVRTGRFLANRVQLLLAQDRLDPGEALAATGAYPDPFGLPQGLALHHLDRDAGGLEGALLRDLQVGVRHFRMASASRCCTAAILSPAPSRARLVDASPG